MSETDQCSLGTMAAPFLLYYMKIYLCSYKKVSKYLSICHGENSDTHKTTKNEHAY